LKVFLDMVREEGVSSLQETIRRLNLAFLAVGLYDKAELWPRRRASSLNAWIVDVIRLPMTSSPISPYRFLGFHHSYAERYGMVPRNKRKREGGPTVHQYVDEIEKKI